MRLTDIFKFKKPEQTDTYNIDDQNDNWDAAENILKELANVNHSHESVPTLTTARAIDGVNFNGSVAISHYGACSTTGATAAKTVSLTNFTLVTGARVIVRFLYANTASSPTLNVNSTGAKAIKYRNSAIGSGLLATSGVYEFVYDGTDWELVGEINSGAASTITSSNLTANRALVSNASGKVAVYSVTSTELGYLDGVTKNIQEQFANLSGKWIQLGTKQTGKTSVTMPNLTKTTDIMIIANINAANSADTDDNAVMLQVHFPVLSGSLPLVMNRLRAGYYQDGSMYGGLVQFAISTTTGTITLERATLNTEEKNTTETTTWTVYYKYNNNL